MKEYTKADLVEFMKWNSTAPISVIKNSTVEELENFLKSRNVWDRFLESLDKYREARMLEARCNKAWKSLKRSTM